MWFSILKAIVPGLISITQNIVKMLADKQLLDAGRAQATVEGLQNAQKEYNLALAAGNAAASDSVSDPFDRSGKT